MNPNSSASDSFKLDKESVKRKLSNLLLYKVSGKIIQNIGLLCEADLPGATLGSLCQISLEKEKIEAEVVGFRGSRTLLMPLDHTARITHGSLVTLAQASTYVNVGKGLLGRVVDGMGQVIDGGPSWKEANFSVQNRLLWQKPTHPLERALVDQPLDLGVRAINGLLSCGKGQRIGIMAGSGVGKSVLLGMMAQKTKADVNVIALIGERGREVREFIEKDLGEEGLKRSVVIVATSDASPLLRIRAALYATCVAEYFRDQCQDVLLLMDSVTRFCMAQREIGLSMGEPPASKGYTPSVFSLLPRMLERAGTCAGGGSITGIYTVLVEGDELDDPVADASRSILDGHIVLDRKLAEKNHYPAIDILQSASRVMRSVVSKEHLSWASQMKDWISAYRQVEDLIQIGAYVKGSNPRTDIAIQKFQRIDQFLKQGVHDSGSFEESIQMMQALVESA